MGNVNQGVATPAEPAASGDPAAISARDPAVRRRGRGLSLRSKLLLTILPIGLLSMGAVALISFIEARESLANEAKDRMVIIRAATKSRVETYFATLRRTFGVFSEDVAMVAATNLFIDGFNQLGRDKLATERRQKLEGFYRADFVPALNKVPGFEQITFDNVWPRTDRALEAQTLFIAENPNPADQRAKLVDHPVSNPYTLVHFTSHPWLTEVASRLRLHDLLIVDVTTGNIVYTMAKEADFGTNLVEGPYATTTLGRLYRRVVDEHRKGYIRMTDFDFYAPSLGAPSLFLATPVYANFRLVAVLIGQLSSDETNKMLNGDRSWKADGFGETGFAFVAGQDMLPRTEERGFIESPGSFLETVAEKGVPASTVDAIRRHGTTILRLPLRDEALGSALAGESGTRIGSDTLGIEVVEAYAPLNVPDVNWVISAQSAVSEVFAPLRSLERNTMILACALALLITLISLALASRLLRPLNNLVSGPDSLPTRAGDENMPVLRGNEISRIAERFDVLEATVRERDRTIQTKNVAYSALLQRLFPDAVAKRLRSGETQSVETVQNVSVVHLAIAGFVRGTEHLDGSSSVDLLNELVDSLDAITEENGLDRVLISGAHYVAVCGLNTPRLDHARRVVAFADAAAAEVKAISARHGTDLDTRIGIASGKVHAGLVGNRRFAFDVWGWPVNTARRLSHETIDGEICVVAETVALLGSDHGFAERPAIATSAGPLSVFGRAPFQSGAADRAPVTAVSVTA